MSTTMNPINKYAFVRNRIVFSTPYETDDVFPSSTTSGPKCSALNCDPAQQSGIHTQQGRLRVKKKKAKKARLGHERPFAAYAQPSFSAL
jgi:hypothetical protein